VRREVVALLVSLLLFNTAYSILHPGAERGPLGSSPPGERRFPEVQRAAFNLTPLKVGDAKSFTSSFYASLSSPDGTFNFTQTIHTTGETEVQGYATREDAHLNPTPSVMIEEYLEGSMQTRLLAQGEEHTGEGLLKISMKRFLSLEDLSLVRVEVNEEYTSDGTRRMTEVATLYPEGESYRTLLTDALEGLASLQEGVIYTVNKTLDPSPLPLPPAVLNLLIEVNATGDSALITFKGSSGGLKLKGWVEVERGHHFPRGVNLTVWGTFGGYRVLLKFEERAWRIVAGGGGLISFPPSQETNFSEVLPFQHIPAPGEGYNVSLYGSTPEDVLGVLEGFLSARGEELIEVHRVTFQLNTSATDPLWNISLTSTGGRYFLVVDPVRERVQSFGEDETVYIERDGAKRGITLSYHYRLLKRASPEGFFTFLGEPNPTMKIYFYRERPLLSLPVRLPLPLPAEGGFFLSVAADPKEPGRLLFTSVSLVDGRVLASGSVEGEVL